jgi:hypothetical protein
MIRVYEILISLAVIVLVAFVGARFRGVAGIIASMPMTIPLTMAIVYQNTGRSAPATAEFARAAVVGMVGTACFTLVAWLALRRDWPFWAVLGAGYAAWGVVVLLWYLAGRLLARGG